MSNLNKLAAGRAKDLADVEWLRSHSEDGWSYCGQGRDRTPTAGPCGARTDRKASTSGWSGWDVTHQRTLGIRQFFIPTVIAAPVD